MRNRRFVLLLAVLVTLNTALWLAPQGLALRQVVVANLFGRKMIRADVVESTGCPTSCVEWRVARGIVVTGTPTLLTVREVDGKTEAIVVSSSTKVTGTGRPVGVGGLKPGWRVLVTWPAPAGTADSVVIEKRNSSD